MLARILCRKGEEFTHFDLWVRRDREINDRDNGRVHFACECEYKNHTIHQRDRSEFVGRARVGKNTYMRRGSNIVSR